MELREKQDLISAMQSHIMPQKGQGGPVVTEKCGKKRKRNMSNKEKYVTVKCYIVKVHADIAKQT